MKHILMLCTGAPGGMAEAAASLQRSALRAGRPVRLLVTHVRGRAAQRLATALGALAEFLWLLLTGRVALVHAHVSMRGSLWRKGAFLELARLFGVPTVFHLHGSAFAEFYEGECGRLRRWLVRRSVARATAVVALSESRRAYLARVAPAARLRVIPNMVDAAAIQAGMARCRAPRSACTLLFLGELGARKGVYDLVRALRPIAAACPEVRLVAAGEGEIERVRALARAIGVEERVVLPGWVSGEEKMRLLAQASVYVLPSYRENLPVSILEAMAAGLPVVSTRVGGIPDAVRHGREALLGEPGALDELARHIVQLLADRALRERMGANGRRRAAAHFSPAVVGALLENLYAEHCARAGELPARGYAGPTPRRRSSSWRTVS